MKATIDPGAVNGIVIAPPSKSITQRAYAAALLHKGTTIVRHSGHSNDERAALHIITQLGAKVLPGDDYLTIHSHGVSPVSSRIDCGESGLATRLFTPIAALSSETATITGSGSLLKRPMDEVKDPLTALGIDFTDFSGYLPFSLRGPLQPKSIKINAGNGSQFLSGLLFALSEVAKEPITIEVAGLKSRPYIDMTLEVLAHFGRPINHTDYRRFFIDPSLFTYQETVEIDVAADWSSAAYFLVAGAIAGNITITNLPTGSNQADEAIIEVLKNTNAKITVNGNSISVEKSRLQAFEFDATHTPDLFPILAILAACCDGDSHITGVHRLFHKESNRVESIAEMLGDFNVPFSVENDTWCISGVNRLQGTIIDSYNDHRIVMAGAIGALRAYGPVTIPDGSPVNKSYPDFFKHLILCGAQCTLE